MPDRRDAPSILAILTVRDEGAFLIDWLAHHRAAGITDFLVFSNDCRDGTDAMLDRLERMGWITHVRNDGPHRKGPQWDALKRAEVHPLTRAADWILVIDIDEFVNVHAGDRTIPALLSALPEATAIALTWRLFGNAGVVAHEDRPVTEVFTRAAPATLRWPWRASMFKTLYRNDGTYARLGVHRPRQGDPARLAAQRWFDGSGRELPGAFRTGRLFTDPGQDCSGLVQLNHYALGAMESYVVKCDRGRANREGQPFDMSYWVDRNFATVEDRTILALAPPAAALREGLRDDPVLGALHRRAVAWRRQRFDELLLEEPYRALFARLLMTPETRVLTERESALVLAHAQRAARARGPGETDAGDVAD